MAPSIGHEVDQAEATAFLDQMSLQTGHGHLVRTCVTNIYPNR